MDRVHVNIIYGILHFICFVKIVPAEEHWSPREGSGYEYYFSSKPDSWIGAEAFCSRLNSHLATVHESQEDTWIQNTRRRRENYWIGLHSDKGEDLASWTWVDGSIVDFTNWDIFGMLLAQPNRNGEACGYYSGGYVTMNWYDDGCSERKLFICKQEIDACMRSLCLNNGTCVDTLHGYECLCTDGYVGNNCEHELDMCLSSPCKHGGHCVNSPTGFQCECSRGYSGDLCQMASSSIDTTNKSSNGIWIALLVTGIAVILLASLAFIFVIRQRRAKLERKKNKQTVVSNTLYGEEDEEEKSPLHSPVQFYPDCALYAVPNSHSVSHTHGDTSTENHAPEAVYASIPEHPNGPSSRPPVRKNEYCLATDAPHPSPERHYDVPVFTDTDADNTVKNVPVHKPIIPSKPVLPAEEKSYNVPLCKPISKRDNNTSKPAPHPRSPSHVSQASFYARKHYSLEEAAEPPVGDNEGESHTSSPSPCRIPLNPQTSIYANQNHSIASNSDLLPQIKEGTEAVYVNQSEVNRDNKSQIDPVKSDEIDDETDTYTLSRENISASTPNLPHKKDTSPSDYGSPLAEYVYAGATYRPPIKKKPTTPSAASTDSYYMEMTSPQKRTGSFNY